MALLTSPPIDSKWQISWSMLESYEQCPLKFYHSYVLRETQPSHPSAFYGCAFHSLMRLVFERCEFGWAFASGEWGRVLRDERSGRDCMKYLAIGQAEIAEMELQGRQQLSTFFRMAADEGLLHPAEGVELSVKGHLRDHRVKAKIDLLTQTRYGLTLVDWKTGKPDRKHLHQLALYAGLVMRALGREVRAIAPAYLQTGQIYFQPVDADLRVEAGRHIVPVYEAMISDVEFSPRKNKYCKGCHLRAGGKCGLFNTCTVPS